LNGTVIKIISMMEILKAGLNIKSLRPARLGARFSFVKSLIASLNGWKMPARETLFGPLRSWLKPKIFRSSKVTNATDTRTGIITKALATYFI
jgi:hypothetical protein